jgi:uncharacterized protein (DUF305 family)
VLALAACDGGGDPVQQALRETSAKNHAATVREGATPRTLAATRDQTYIAQMIEHDGAAIATAQAALRDSRDPEIRRMAQAVIEARSLAIAEMRAWMPPAAPTPPAGSPPPPPA